MKLLMILIAILLSITAFAGEKPLQVTCTVTQEIDSRVITVGELTLGSRQDGTIGNESYKLTASLGASCAADGGSCSKTHNLNTVLIGKTGSLAMVAQISELDTGKTYSSAFLGVKSRASVICRVR